MRVASTLVAAAGLVAACGGGYAETVPRWPDQTYAPVRVTLVRPSGTPFVAPPLPVGNTVALIGSVFEPNGLQLPVGTTVTWTDRDAIAHTVTSGVPLAPDGAFDGQLGGLGATFSWTFSVAGTFPYYCRFHAGGMHATIVVR
jgi:hypothetical protein